MPLSKLILIVYKEVMASTSSLEIIGEVFMLLNGLLFFKGLMNRPNRAYNLFQGLHEGIIPFKLSMPKFVWREKNTQLDKGNDLLHDQQKEEIPFITLPKHFIGSNIALLHQTALICKFTNSPLSSEIISRWAKDNWFGLKEIFPVDST